MPIVAPPAPLASAFVVLCGQHGDVTRLAHQRGTCRQTLYRETAAVLDAVTGTRHQQQCAELQQHVARLEARCADLEARCADLEARLRQAIVLDADKQAEVAAVAQAEGVSLPTTQRLLRPLLGSQTPSVAQLGRYTQEAQRRATACLEILDAFSRPLAEHAATDELFAGQRPVLMAVEPHSLCWLAGQLSAHRDGETWATVYRQFPNLEVVLCDLGVGMAKGRALVNDERQRAAAAAATAPPPSGPAPAAGVVVDVAAPAAELVLLVTQDDHFHVLQEGTRALWRLRGQASKALAKAEKAEQALTKVSRQGTKRTGAAVRAACYWRQAEKAMDRWAAGEKALAKLRQALPLFTPEGELNTRARAEAAVQALLPEFAGPEWSKLCRYLKRPELFTFLDRAQEQLAALPVPEDVRQLAVHCVGLERRPETWKSAGPSAAVQRGVLLLTTHLLAQQGVAGSTALELVRKVLGGLWRASSVVEGLNSVLRMQQARHRRLTPGLLDLKRLYWNCRVLRTGRRRKQTPYGRLGLKLPAVGWWELIHLPPEQLREQLSALNQVS